jgi:hypothetical protein
MPRDVYSADHLTPAQIPLSDPVILEIMGPSKRSLL